MKFKQVSVVCGFLSISLRGSAAQAEHEGHNDRAGDDKRDVESVLYCDERRELVADMRVQAVVRPPIDEYPADREVRGAREKRGNILKPHDHSPSPDEEGDAESKRERFAYSEQREQRKLDGAGGRYFRRWAPESPQRAVRPRCQRECHKDDGKDDDFARWP